MPQVKDGSVKDGWFLNQAKDADNNPRPLSLGTVAFKAGQKRFVPARLRLESRFTNQAFEKALANGNLKAIGAEEKAPVVAMPAPPPPSDDPPPPPEDPPIEEPKVMTRSELMSMNKDELVAMCQEKGLNDSGSKSKLADRILVSQE